MNTSIKAISYYLPAQVLTNDELSSRFPDLRIDDLTRLTGVKERHVAAGNETSVDMAEKSARRLFEEHNIDPGRIDFLILCSQYTDYITPASSCILQDRLSIPETAGTVDISQGCTGYIYGLALARGLIASRAATNVLLLTSEAITRSIHREDKSNLAIFGDASAATLISPSDDEGSIGEMVFGTDGSGYQEIIIRQGGARYPLTRYKGTDYPDGFGNIRNDACFFMNGAAIFTFSVNTVPVLIKNILEKNKTEKEDIDLYVFHQANRIILETLFRKNKIPEEKSMVFLEKVGNTVSSTIPLALYEAMKSGRAKKGDRILLAAFGVGLSWGGTVIRL